MNAECALRTNANIARDVLQPAEEVLVPREWHREVVIEWKREQLHKLDEKQKEDPHGALLDLAVHQVWCAEEESIIELSI